MARTTAPLLPSTTELLERLGERLRLARLRRRLTAKQVAERAGMAPMTLRNLERGGAGVTMGAYLAVMQVLGVEKDLALLGATDRVGRELQDARLTTRDRSSAHAKSLTPPASFERVKHTQAADAAARCGQTTAGKPETEPRSGTGGWAEKSGFTSARGLLDLIDIEGTAPSRRG